MPTSLIAHFWLASAVFAPTQAPEPPADLKKLDFLIGEWAGSMEWTSNGKPQNSATTWSFRREGMFIRHSANVRFMGFAIVEDRIIGWSAARKRYSSHTFTKLIPTPRVEWGKLSGERLVLLSEPWYLVPGEPPVVSRATLSKRGRTLHFLIESKENGKWIRQTDGVFRRKE